jgi:hypothetical protein
VAEEIRKSGRWSRVKQWLQVTLWLIVLGGAALAAFGFWEAGAVAVFILLVIVGTLEWRN